MNASHSILVNVTRLFPQSKVNAPPIVVPPKFWITDHFWPSASAVRNKSNYDYHNFRILLAKLKEYKL